MRYRTKTICSGPFLGTKTTVFTGGVAIWVAKMVAVAKKNPREYPGGEGANVRLVSKRIQDKTLFGNYQQKPPHNGGGWCALMGHLATHLLRPFLTTGRM